MPVCHPCQRQQHDRCEGCLVCQHRPTSSPTPEGPSGDSTTTPITKENNA